MKNRKIKSLLTSLLLIICVFFVPQVAHADVVPPVKTLGLLALAFLGAVLVVIIIITLVAIKLLKGKKNVDKFH